MANITKNNIYLELAVEQLRRIGFSGDPYEEVKKDGWYSRHQWPSQEMADKFKDWAQREMKRVYKLNKNHLAREWGYWNLNYGIRQPTKL